MKGTKGSGSSNAQPPEKRVVFSAKAGLKFTKKPVADGAEPQNMLTGYALVWNTLSSDRGGYRVRLAPGSAVFADPCLALYEHDFRAVLGNTANGTLRVKPDDVGVYVEIDLPDTTSAADVAELVEDGYVGGMSFSMANGFEESTIISEGGLEIVNATKFTVDEVTVCVQPAFIDAEVKLAGGADDDDAEQDPPTERLNQSARWQRNRLHLYRLRAEP